MKNIRLITKCGTCNNHYNVFYKEYNYPVLKDLKDFIPNRTNYLCDNCWSDRQEKRIKEKYSLRTKINAIIYSILLIIKNL